MLSVAVGGVIGIGLGDVGRSSSLFESAELVGSSVVGVGLFGEVTAGVSFALCSDSLRSAGAASVSMGSAGAGIGGSLSGEVASVDVSVSALSGIVSGGESVVVDVVVVAGVDSEASSNCIVVVNTSFVSTVLYSELLTHRLLVVTLVLFLNHLHLCSIAVVVRHGDADGDAAALFRRLAWSCLGA